MNSSDSATCSPASETPSATAAPLPCTPVPVHDLPEDSVSPELQDAQLPAVIDSSQVSSPPRQVNTPDCQVNSSDSPTCTPDSETPETDMTTSPLPLVPSSPLHNQPERSLSPEISLSPESLVSLSGPPPELESCLTPIQVPEEPPEIQCPSLPHQPESEVCLSTTLPASAASPESVADLASSGLTHAEAELADKDREIESGEKLDDTDVIESAVGTEDGGCVSEMSCSTSAKGTVFGCFELLMNVFFHLNNIEI